MIITDKFVMLNFPKTGSTFVRKVLKQIHSEKESQGYKKLIQILKFKKDLYFNNLWLPNIRDNTFRNGQLDEHGIYIQIPNEHKNKRIVSIRRNLFERYISLYEYKDWQITWKEIPRIVNNFSNFPNLSFEEYMKINLEDNPFGYNKYVNKKLNIGLSSAQFILFYFKEPFKTLQKINEHYINSNQYINDIADVHFLDQKKLNWELYNFLLKMGYRKSKIEFILTSEKVNISTPSNKSINDYYSQDLINLVKKKDYLLFKIFNNFYV